MAVFLLCLKQEDYLCLDYVCLVLKFCAGMQLPVQSLFVIDINGAYDSSAFPPKESSGQTSLRRITNGKPLKGEKLNVQISA
jgi:hypothetical protein